MLVQTDARYDGDIAGACHGLVTWDVLHEGEGQTEGCDRVLRREHHHSSQLRARETSDTKLVSIKHLSVVSLRIYFLF